MNPAGCGENMQPDGLDCLGFVDHPEILMICSYNSGTTSGSISWKILKVYMTSFKQEY